jgi:hypothetical protein
VNSTLKDDIAALAVDNTSIIIAVAHSDGHDILGPTRSSSSPSSKPKNNKKPIDDENSKDVVCAAKAGDLFGEDDVGDCKPSKDRLGVLVRGLMKKGYC